MKLSFLAALSAAILYSCAPNIKKSKSNANELIYSSADTSVQYLSARLDLIGDINKKELIAQVKLSNSGSAPVDIREAGITTSQGIRSEPVAGFAPFLLGQGKDTTLAIKFSPVNDLKLFQVTGLQGYFTQGYAVSIAYKEPGNENLMSLALRSYADKNEFLAYNRNNKKPVTGYSFNTKTGFNGRQTKYLETLKQAGQRPFVYLSEQEIAISGLNFRFKSYYEQDTLHGEFAIVNHADFPVKIVRDSLNITINGKPSPKGTNIITLEKISGAQQDPNMMEKGDRVLIHYKKHIKLQAPGRDSLTLHLRNAFMLTGRKTLFNEDVQLLPVQF